MEMTKKEKKQLIEIIDVVINRYNNNQDHIPPLPPEVIGDQTFKAEVYQKVHEWFEEAVADEFEDLKTQNNKVLDKVIKKSNKIDSRFVRLENNLDDLQVGMNRLSKKHNKLAEDMNVIKKLLRLWSVLNGAGAGGYSIKKLKKKLKKKVKSITDDFNMNNINRLS